MTDTAIARTLAELDELVEEAPAAGRDVALRLLEEPCPCDGCPTRELCARERRACIAFREYVAGAAEGQWRALGRHPEQRHFDLVFPDASRPAVRLPKQPKMNRAVKLERQRLAQQRLRDRRLAEAAAVNA